MTRKGFFMEKGDESFVYHKKVNSNDYRQTAYYAK
jgi:hypothetical protein